MIQRVSRYINKLKVALMAIQRILKSIGESTRQGALVVALPNSFLRLCVFACAIHTPTCACERACGRVWACVVHACVRACVRACAHNH